MFLVSCCSCLCLIHWSQVSSREWRCSWSNTDRQCSNNNKVNPGYFSPAATARKLSMFLHISARVWRRRWSTHIRTEGFYVKTAIIHQWTRLCVPGCVYTESMFINFIHVGLYDISLMQNILYQIKRDVAIWKSLGCPQRKQRTWWQIVATPYTGLA